MKDLLGLDYIEIRLLDRATGRLVPLLTEGMTTLGGQPRALCPQGGQRGDRIRRRDRSELPLPRHHARPALPRRGGRARSSLTVPLIYHGTVIGTLNVENAQPNAFDDRDRQFLEIYGRNVASALNTLELLQAEKFTAAAASVEAISRELALPLDDILNDATTVLDRYAGHDEDIIARLRHLLYRAREIRSLIQKVGSDDRPRRRSGPRRGPRPGSPAPGSWSSTPTRPIRRSAHHLLGCQGATVETARDAHEAIALARQTPYTAALVDIRLPDLDGFETYKRLREVQPGVPIILMTGFGYDPSHSIVKARQEGLAIGTLQAIPGRSAHGRRGTGAADPQRRRETRGLEAGSGSRPRPPRVLP